MGIKKALEVKETAIAAINEYEDIIRDKENRTKGEIIQAATKAINGLVKALNEETNQYNEAIILNKELAAAVQGEKPSKVSWCWNIDEYYILSIIGKAKIAYLSHFIWWSG